MTSDKTEKLQEIFRVVLNLAPDRDVTTVRQLNERNWDSLATVTLATAIESEFGVSIETVDAMRMTSYEATRLLLEEKGA